MPEDSRKQVRQLFMEVADLPDAERAAALTKACAGDATLRAEVDALLQAEAQAGGFMASPTVESDAAMVPASRAATITAFAHEQPGAQIGHYKLLQLIGEGGFGVVYMAEQEQPIRRKVALKIIKLGMDTRQVIARFEAERQALAMMDHPNIAKVLDAGATATGRPYFVMELVRGEPITQYCDKHKLSVEERLALFQQTCSAVQHAHQKGIIHRDIKPSNVMITLHDGKPVPKVIDFGIAKATNQRLTEKTVFTEYRQFIGTPEYMSPEQAEMSGIDIDTRSDIYSLGVLLYELLTGTTPFDSDQLRSAAFGEIQRIIREETPARPSTRLSTMDTLPSVAAQRHTEPKQLGLIIRGDLDWIVMKSLEKDRTRRYETANGLAADIHRYLNNEPVEATPPSVGYKVRKFVRRNRAGVTAAALILAVLVLAVLGTTWGLVQAKKQERFAIQAAEAETKAKERANAREAETKSVLDFLENKIFTAPRPKGIEGGQGYDVKLVDAIAAALPDVERSFTSQPLIEARLRKTLGQSFEYLGQPSIAEQQWRRASEIYTANLGPDDPDTIACMHSLAVACAMQAKYDEATPLFEKVIEARRHSLGNDHIDTLTSIFALGTLQYYQGHYDLAEKSFDEALAGRRRTLGPEHADTLQSIRSQGMLRLVQGRLAESEALYREAVETCRRKFGPDHPDTLTTMGGLSNALKWQRKYSECELVDRSVLDFRRRRLGDDHPETMIAMSNLGETLRNLQEYPEAEALLREAIERQRRVLGSDHPDTLISISRMGVLLFDMEKYDLAEPFYRETLEGRRRQLGNEHSQTLVAINNMGFLLKAMGRPAEAEALYREAFEANRRARGEDHPDTLTNLNNIALLLLAQGKVDEAESGFRNVLDGRRRTLGESHPETHSSLQNLAMALMRSDRNAEAEALLRECHALRIKSLPATDARVAETQSLLGKAVAKQGRFAEAESMLLQAYEKLQPPASAKLRSEAAGRVVELYEAWHAAEPAGGYDAKSTEWRMRVEATK